MAPQEASIAAFAAAHGQRPSWPGIDGSLRPASIEDAYRLQQAVHRRIAESGDARVGWKVGSTSAGSQKGFGLGEPVYAGLFASGRSATLREGLSRPLTRPSVECEIAVILRTGLDAGDLSDERLKDAIGACHIACEIIDNRYGEPMALGVPSLIVDDFFQAGFVIGPENTAWRSQDLAAAEGFSEVGTQRIEGAARNGLSALASLRWLAGALARTDQSLRAGEIVLTGTLPPPVPVPLPAAPVRMGITGFPTLEFG